MAAEIDLKNELIRLATMLLKLRGFMPIGKLTPAGPVKDKDTLSYVDDVVTIDGMRGETASDRWFLTIYLDSLADMNGDGDEAKILEIWEDEDEDRFRPEYAQEVLDHIRRCIPLELMSE